MAPLLTMITSDLRQRVRDKSVIIFALIVPLGLMFVFDLVFGGVEELELEPVTVAAAVPDGDQLGGILVHALGEVQDFDVTVDDVEPGEVRPLAESGAAQLGIIVPESFTASMTAGDGATVEVVRGEGAGIEAEVLLALAQGVLERLEAGTVAAAAASDAGLPPEQAAAIAQQAATAAPTIALTEGEASDEQLSVSGGLVAGQAGLFLLFTVGFGVLGLVAEREQGTLARLRSMPMHPGLVVISKAVVSFILGVVATSILLLVGSLFFEVDFGSPLVVAVLVVCAVAAGTSLMFIIARLARTAEQANVLQSMFALVLGIAAGAFFPIVSSGMVARLLDLNPIAAFIRGLGISSGGGSLADVGVPVTTMLGFVVVCLAVSRLVPDRGRNL